MTTGWRELTEAEIVHWPKARLGGALGVMCALSGVLAALLVVLAIVAIAKAGTLGELENPFKVGTSPREIAYAVSFVSVFTSLLTLGSAAAFFIMTLARIRATPLVCVFGMAGIYVALLASEIMKQFIIFSPSTGGSAAVLLVLVPQIPAWIACATLVAGLSGYLLGGVRPNAYFRRRVAIPISTPRRAP